jgi:hypothetical protein
MDVLFIHLGLHTVVSKDHSTDRAHLLGPVAEESILPVVYSFIQVANSAGVGVGVGGAVGGGGVCTGSTTGSPFRTHAM